MDVFVPPGNPRAFESQFINVHPALGLKETAGSGSVWGDGDGRPEIIDHSELQFALETKVRSNTGHTRPRSQEWKDALGQLKKRNPGAVRLFVVYCQDPTDSPTSTYGVSIPPGDNSHLSHLGISGADLGTKTQIPSGESELFHYEFDEWKELYDGIQAFLNT